MNPYVLLALALGFATACGGSYWQGRTDGRNGERTANTEAVAAAQAAVDQDRKAQQEKAKSLSRRLQAQIATQAITNREISDELEKALGKANLPPICNITDDLLRVWNDANAGRKSDAGAELPSGSAAPTAAKVQGSP